MTLFSHFIKKLESLFSHNEVNYNIDEKMHVKTSK